jgi:diguanylate cyclase (GGDEF)-like protein
MLATTDALTGLPNRRRFDDHLNAEWKRSSRKGATLALVAIDVDYFKKYNDRFGHPAGDECLRKVAQAIKQTLRSGELAARVGGEEFALLLPNSSVEAATRIAERVRQCVEELRLEHPLNPAKVVTISLGVATGLPAECPQIGSLAKAADDALYLAKEAGRNRAYVAEAASH